MTVVYVDAKLTDDERRERLFAGDIFIFTPTAGSLELINFAREMAEEAFAPHFPPDAQHHMDPQDYVNVLAGLKPSFINHPRCKAIMSQMFAELGCAGDSTYLDVPRMRTMTSDFLNAGLTYQFHAHRDTWFSAPMCQINWWMPIYDVTESNVMAFHPRYFDEKVANSSEGYGYDAWKASGRTSAAQQVTKETRWQPEAQEAIEAVPEIRVVTPPGGILMFSGAQLHSTVPNSSGKTRFSIDFRTVNKNDVEARRGAKNVDSACSGTTLGDFLRSTDLAQLPEDLIASYA